MIKRRCLKMRKNGRVCHERKRLDCRVRKRKDKKERVDET